MNTGGKIPAAEKREWVEIYLGGVRSRPILLKKSLCNFCLQKLVVDIEIWANTDAQLLQISRNSASIGRFFGFLLESRGNPDFFNRIGQ